MKRLCVLILLPLTLLGAGRSDLIVHEWGTFTSRAGPDGRAVEWAPFDGPSDLPRFVTLLNPTSVKTGPKGYLPSLTALVRMETPVIYFYANREATVSVRAGFPHGLITEWYPPAIVPPVMPSVPLKDAKGGIEWKDVRVSPLLQGPFPVEAGKSHYYAARETDASPVAVGAHIEKFLFYRGLASFPVPVAARLNGDGSLALENTGPAIDWYILFERRGERLGYVVVRDGSPVVTVPRPALSESLASIRAELEALLVEQGLYAREAAAMVETWRDVWFEDGTRLFYAVPRASVDDVLPLDIEPRPAELVRAFVGRFEIGGGRTHTSAHVQ